MGSLSVRPSAGIAQAFEIAASYGVDLEPKPFDVCRTASEYQSFRVATSLGSAPPCRTDGPRRDNGAERTGASYCGRCGIATIVCSTAIRVFKSKATRSFPGWLQPGTI